MLPTIPLGSSVYAVYEVNEAISEFDTVSIQMINNNQDQKIGLAPIYIKEMNGMCQSIQYDVTGKVTLQEYLVRTLSQDEFRRMILNLVSTIEGFEEYMIDSTRVMLEPDSVYINMLDGSISFICVPLKHYQHTVTLFDFFRDVADRSYVTVNSGGISYFDCVRNIIKSESGFSLSNIRASMNVLRQDQNAAMNQGTQTVQPLGMAEDLTQPPVPEQVPDTITVSNAPVYVPPIMPVEDPAKKEKKSLFGGLFGSSSKGSGKKKKSDAPAGGFQGGIAGLKGGSKKQQDAPQIPPPIDVPPMQVPPMQIPPAQVPPMQQPQMNNTPLNFGGTTVLSSGMANPSMQQPPVPPMQQPPVSPIQQPQIPPIQQPSVPPMQQPQIQPAPQMPQNPAPQQPAFQGGTTVLNSGMARLQEPAAPIPAPPVIPAAPTLQPIQTDAVSLQKNVPEKPEMDSASKGTTVLRPSAKASGPATTVLTPHSGRKYFIVQIGTHQRILIDKDVIRIGRDSAGLDFNVSDNTNVGHNHANIVKRGEDYYLVDLNSLNHTYLNGAELVGGKEYPLTDGDRFTCADEEFRFIMG